VDGAPRASTHDRTRCMRLHSPPFSQERLKGIINEHLRSSNVYGKVSAPCHTVCSTCPAAAAVPAAAAGGRAASVNEQARA
jgi:hypothetical protein